MALSIKNEICNYLKSHMTETANGDVQYILTIPIEPSKNKLITIHITRVENGWVLAECGEILGQEFKPSESVSKAISNIVSSFKGKIKVTSNIMSFFMTINNNDSLYESIFMLYQFIMFVYSIATFSQN